MHKKIQQVNIHGPDDILLDDVDYPKLGSHDIIVKIKCCGICGTDLGYLASGGLMGPQDHLMPLGHEMSGEVVDVGSDVVDIELNSHVAINPMSNNNNIGNGGSEGGMTDYLLVRNAVIDENVFILPNNTSFEVGALVEPFAVALRSINRSNVNSESHVAVLGLGCIGLAVAILLDYFGYKKIITLDISSYRSNCANNIHNVESYDHWDNFIDNLKNTHGSENLFGMEVVGTDVFIDCTGSHSLVNKIINISKPNSRIVITGLHKEPALVDFRGVLMRELELSASMAYSSKEFKESLDILSSNKINLQTVISHKFTLAEFKEAFKTAGNGEISGKVMFDI